MRLRDSPDLIPPLLPFSLASSSVRTGFRLPSFSTSSPHFPTFVFGLYFALCIPSDMLEYTVKGGHVSCVLKT
nr:MAG TPA: hypothetical protein [Caudoviricetes sp.]